MALQSGIVVVVCVVAIAGSIWLVVFIALYAISHCKCIVGFCFAKQVFEQQDMRVYNSMEFIRNGIASVHMQKAFIV